MNTRWMLEALQDMQDFAAMNNLWDSYQAFQVAKKEVAGELAEIQAYQAQHTHSTIGINSLAQEVFLQQSAK